VRLLSLALAATLLLTACSWDSTGSGDAAPTPQAQASGSPSVPTAAATATTGPSPTGPFDQRTGAEVAAAGSQAMSTVTSLHYRLAVRGGTNPTTADVRATDAGACSGAVKLGDGRIQILGVPGHQWFKADPAAWRLISPDNSDQYIKAAGDHWVDDEGFEVANFCFFQQLLGQTFQDIGTGTWFTVGAGRIDGHDVVRVQGSGSGGGVAVAAVRVDEPHYLASFRRTDDSDGAVSAGRFSDFQEDVQVEAPADDDVVDLSSLQ